MYRAPFFDGHLMYKCYQKSCHINYNDVILGILRWRARTAGLRPSGLRVRAAHVALPQRRNQSSLTH